VTRLTYRQDKISEHDIAERVRLHMPLARKIAWQMHGRVRDLFEIEDLIQIGMTTLVEAAQRFQDTGEASFGTYASVRVRGALVDHLRSHLAMTRTAVQRRNRIESAELAVRQRGIPPNKFSLCTWRSVVDAKVGVVSGTILGQPDISAVDRIGRITTENAKRLFKIA
jgi:RNA polymerase sigma factor (sigma-70 family)